MKTLEQIKNETATKHGFLSLVELITLGHTINTLKVIDEMLILVQKECLKNAEKNLNIQEYGKDKVINFGITDDQNIIR